MKLSEEYKAELIRLAGISSLRLYLISFDRGSVSSEVSRKRVMEFILSGGDGEIIKCPVQSTIVFASNESYEYWLGKANSSEVLSGIRFIIVEITPPIKDTQELFGHSDTSLVDGCHSDSLEVKAKLSKGESYKDVL